MNILKHTLTSCLAILLIFPVMGQQQHQHTAACAVGYQEGQQIKARMLENRRNIDPSLLLQRSNTTWIPVGITLIGDTDGTGYVSLENTLAMFCSLNDDFASQNIQFYIKQPIQYLNSYAAHRNAFSSAASSAMISNKIPGCMNVFVGQSLNNATASYYSGWGDYMFMLAAQTNGSSGTLSHEVGHFFTLPHTFSGWENIDYTPNSPSPTVNANGATVENVARNNCTSAGDGFCDTPADYESDRAPCPFTGGAQDPSGAALTPDEGNVMSYFYSSCRTDFSNDQKAAMLSDLISRGWSNFPAPSSQASVSGLGVTAVMPTDNQEVGITGNMRLEWSPVTGATGYMVTMERTIFGTPVQDEFKVMVWGQNHYTFDANILQDNGQYRWKVRPLNEYQVCGAESNFFAFTSKSVGTNVSTVENEDLQFNIQPQPVQGSTANLAIRANASLTGNLRIYGMDGRMYTQLQNLEVTQGEQNFTIDVSMLGTGTYVVVLLTEHGSMQKKLVIQH